MQGMENESELKFRETVQVRAALVVDDTGKSILEESEEAAT